MAARGCFCEMRSCSKAARAVSLGEWAGGSDGCGAVVGVEVRAEVTRALAAAREAGERGRSMSGGVGLVGGFFLGEWRWGGEYRGGSRGSLLLEALVGMVSIVRDEACPGG